MSTIKLVYIKPTHGKIGQNNIFIVYKIIIRCNIHIDYSRTKVDNAF